MKHTALKFIAVFLSFILVTAVLPEPFATFGVAEAQQEHEICVNSINPNNLNFQCRASRNRDGNYVGGCGATGKISQQISGGAFRANNWPEPPALDNEFANVNDCGNGLIEISQFYNGQGYSPVLSGSSLTVNRFGRGGTSATSCNDACFSRSNIGIGGSGSLGFGSCSSLPIGISTGSIPQFGSGVNVGGATSSRTLCESGRSGDNCKGSYGCPADQYCMCTSFGIAFNYQSGDRDVGIQGFNTDSVPGTRGFIRDPADITPAPKRPANDVDCSQPSRVALEADINPKLVPTGTQITVTGSVDKFSNTCRGVQYECRAQYQQGCRSVSRGPFRRCLVPKSCNAGDVPIPGGKRGPICRTNWLAIIGLVIAIVSAAYLAYTTFFAAPAAGGVAPAAGAGGLTLEQAVQLGSTGINLAARTAGEAGENFNKQAADKAFDNLIRQEENVDQKTVEKRLQQAINIGKAARVDESGNANIPALTEFLYNYNVAALDLQHGGPISQPTPPATLSHFDPNDKVTNGFSTLIRKNDNYWYDAENPESGFRMTDFQVQRLIEEEGFQWTPAGGSPAPAPSASNPLFQRVSSPASSQPPPAVITQISNALERRSTFLTDSDVAASGMAKSGAELYLKVAGAESGFVQCTDGSFSCTANTILKHKDGTSVGIMGINTARSDLDYVVALACAEPRNGVYDSACNIDVSVYTFEEKLAAADRLLSGRTRPPDNTAIRCSSGACTYSCQGVTETYTDRVTFAVRLYNGAACGGGDPNFVKKVREQRVGPSLSGEKSVLTGAFVGVAYAAPTTPPKTPEQQRQEKLEGYAKTGLLLGASVLIPAFAATAEPQGPCYQICGASQGKTALTASPSCAGYPIAATEGFYSCGEQSCGGFKNKDVSIAVKTQDNQVLSEAIVTTDANGDFSYTFTAPQTEGVFIAVVTTEGPQATLVATATTR